MKILNRREAAVLLMTLGVLAFPFVAGGIYLYQKHQWAQNRLSEFEPRYARLLGLEANRENLARATARGQSLLTQYTYPVEQDASQAGNDAQQRIRNLLTASGMDIASSQVLAPKEEKGFQRIPLTVRAEGEMVALEAALAGLAEQAPAILIDAIVIQGQGAPVKGVQRLSVQFSLMVLRRMS